MKQFVTGLLAAVACAACHTGKEHIVDTHFTDSLISHYTVPAAVTANAADLQFWKNRIDQTRPGIVSESRYAAALIGRFHLLGDMEDVRRADSILLQVDSVYNRREAGPQLSLVSHYILQHRFREADSCLQRARQTGIKPYEALAAAFDVDFELGRYSNAALELRQMKAANDYGYYFRFSKLAHIDGATDSALQAMLHAAQLAGNNDGLRQTALSNAADLYLHTGEMQKANDLYMQCIRINAADYHSILGLGWIALVHDHNDSLANCLFGLVRQKNRLPDALLKQSQMAEEKGDRAAALQYARRFETEATRTVYGNMYNKYLIHLYTGILRQPAKSLMLAVKELGNRATPQTYAWYAWSLAANNKKEEAWEVYRQQVSGRPLEATELYDMGRLMQALGKGYNAHAFFAAAAKNRYDLSPAEASVLDKNLQE